MAVFRVEKNQNYTVMSNHHLKNRELSLKSKGLLSQMLSLTYVYSPTKGTAEKLDDYTVQWKIDELGEKHSEGAVLEFNVEHIGTCSGTMEANDDISYTDDVGSIVSFPSPTIEVDCGTEVCPEHCPEAVDIQVNGCEDVAVKCIRFVVTGDTDVSGSAASFCNTRNFKARFFANYIDSGFDCCDSVK